MYRQTDFIDKEKIFRWKNANLANIVHWKHDHRFLLRTRQ
jgi:hypothetical protein